MTIENHLASHPEGLLCRPSDEAITSCRTILLVDLHLPHYHYWRTLAKISTLAQLAALSFHCKSSTVSVDSQSEPAKKSQGTTLGRYSMTTISLFVILHKLTCGVAFSLCSGSDVKHQATVPVSYQAETCLRLNPSEAVGIHS